MKKEQVKSREERLVYLLQNPQCRPGLLALLRLGEPVTIKLLNLMKKKCPELIKELLSVNFYIPVEYNDYTDELIDTTRDVYNFFCRHLGYDRFKQKIINTPALWPNFLAYLPKKDQPALEERFQALVRLQKMFLAVQMISTSPYLQKPAVQKRLAREVRQVVDWTRRYSLVEGIALIFDFEFLMEADWWDPDALKAYLGAPMYSDELRLNKVLAHKDGAKVLKRLKIPYEAKKQRKPKTDKKA